MIQSSTRESTLPPSASAPTLTTPAAAPTPAAPAPASTGPTNPVLEAVAKVNEVVVSSNGAEADKYLRIIIEHLEKYDLSFSLSIASW